MYQKEYMMTDEQKQKVKDYRREYYKNYYAAKSKIIKLLMIMNMILLRLNNHKILNMLFFF